MADAREFLFANNASCGLSADVGVSDTAIALETGKGSLFPSPASGQIFKITLQNIITGAMEIMNVTARAGDVLTVERAREGTVAQAFSAATTFVQQRITRETLEKLQESGGGAGGGAPANAGYLVYAADGALSNEKVLLGEVGIFAFDDEGSALRIVLNANSITDTKLRQGAATSVVGRAANSVGNLADIAAGADGDVLRRSGGVLGFGPIAQSSVTNLVSDLAALSASIAAKVSPSRAINTANSLTGGGDLSADRTLSLVNDLSSPGANKFYGTDGSGVRGWYAVSTGVTDHGALTGLDDDDHTQYFNQARGDARYSQLGHTHAAGDITSGTFADARIAQSNVVQHEGALGTVIAIANTIMRRDVSGYAYAVYFNQSSSNSENPTISQIMVTNGSDNFFRKASLAHLISQGSLVQTSRTIATQHSLAGGGDLSSNRTLALVGDVASPGASKYYGTNASGTRGWYDLPSGGGGTVIGAFKSTFTTRVSSSPLADPHLQLSLAPGFYAVEGLLVVDTSSGDGFRMGLVSIGGLLSGDAAWVALYPGPAGHLAASAAVNTTLNLGSIGPGNQIYVHVKGLINVSATTTLSVNWSGNAGAGSIGVDTHSWIKATKLN